MNQDRLGSAISRISIAAMRRYLASRVRIHVEGLDHISRHGPAIVVVNHACALDGWLLLCTMPRKVYFFTRATYFANPVVAWYGCAMGALPARSGAERSASLAAAEAVLRAGQLFATFPEGSVNPEPGTVRPFKSGFLLLATKLGLPVVPVAIVGSHRILRDPVQPRGLRGYRLQSTDVQIAVLAPMTFHNPTGDRALFEQQREQVRQTIAGRLHAAPIAC